jgi:hypothetical protein
MFVVVALFSRTELRRIVGVLVAAAPVIPMVMFYDKIAAQLGWWRYPSVTASAAVVVQLLMRRIFGPAQSDALARAHS